MNNHFNHISADENLKAETLKKAKNAKPVRWGVISSIAAVLTVTIAVSAFAFSRSNYKNFSNSDYGSAPESNMAPSYGYSDDSLKSAESTTYTADSAISDDSIIVSDSSDVIEESEGVYEEPGEFAPEAIPVPTKKPEADVNVNLTAAKLDDNKEFDAWLKSTENFSSFKEYDTFGFAAIRRYTVTVLDNDDKPVKNAKVTLLSGEKEIFFTFTTNKGIAYLYYNWYKNASAEKPDKIRVQSKDTVITENIGDRTDIAIKSDFKKTSLTTLDIMFMIDTTGSMGDELSYLKNQTNSMLQTLPTQLDTKISINFYRDTADDYVVKSNPFTSSLAEVSACFEQTDANGGGDTPEAVDEALKDAIDNHSWREGSVKIMFLVLDAPAHDEKQVSEQLYTYVNRASEMGIRIVPVMASGADEVCEIMCRQMALITGGQFVFLTDDSGIGGSHREPITDTDYDVKPLITILKEIINEYTY